MAQSLQHQGITLKNSNEPILKQKTASNRD